jgi:hypothetical protein
MKPTQLIRYYTATEKYTSESFFFVLCQSSRNLLLPLFLSIPSLSKFNDSEPLKINKLDIMHENLKYRIVMIQKDFEEKPLTVDDDELMHGSSHKVLPTIQL